MTKGVSTHTPRLLTGGNTDKTQVLKSSTDMIISDFISD